MSMTLRDWLADGEFGLTMSSGFFGFFAHTGVAVALEEAGHLPVEVSGSSAGALVGAGVATRMGATRLKDELFALKRQDFWDPFPGLGLLRGRLFEQRLRDLLPVDDVAACPIKYSASVFDVFGMKTVVRDAGDLPQLVRTSCTFPFLFHPVWHDGRLFIDGGVLDRPGLEGMRQHRVLYHHLASKSPWRRRGSQALQVPKRVGMKTLVVHGLPRVGPNKLHVGPQAYSAAAKAFERALDRAFDDDGVVHIDVDG